MFRSRFFAAAVVAAFPASLFAQLKPAVSISVPTASSLIKSLSIGDITGSPGTTVSSTTSFAGDSCMPSQCVIARAATGGAASVKMHFGDGSVHVPALQTWISLSHEVAHSLTLSLNGSEFLGLLCNGKGELKASPRFTALGGSTGGYKWELRESGKFVKGGHSSGDDAGIIIDDGSHAVGAMLFGITDRGSITLVHGVHTLLLTPDASDIGSKTGGYLRFEDLGLRTGGVSELAINSPAIVSSVQPPVSR
jgi:hypothetical protein